MNKPQVVSVIGVDPGGIVGISCLDYIGPDLAGFLPLQTNAASAIAVLEGILRSFYSDPEVIIMRIAQIEPFITGRSAGTRGEPAEVTRQLVFQLTETLQLYGYKVLTRKAADIKPWATNKRLERAGILCTPTSDMPHANDASRHALYAAVHDIYRKDPLA